MRPSAPHCSLYIDRTSCMADINIDDVLRMTAELNTVDLSSVQNVYTIKVTVPGAIPIIDILDRIVIILERIYVIIKGLQNSRTKYIDVKFFNITQNIPLPTRSWAAITEGELAVDDLAHMTAAMFSLGVSLPGVQGRKFFGGISETALDQDGLWSTATVVDLALASVIMINDQVNAGTTIKFGILTGVVPAFVQFNSATTKNIPASQRRRRQGVGI